MRRKRMTLLFVLLLLITFTIGPRFSINPKYRKITNLKVVPNVLVIKFEEDASVDIDQVFLTESNLNNLLTRNRISHLQPVLKNIIRKKSNHSIGNISNIYIANFSGNRSPHSVAADLESNPYIIYAEPKYIHFITEIPNDSLYDRQQTYYDIIQAPQAWDLIKGEKSDVIVAVVDGGTDILHADLGSNIWKNRVEIDGLEGVDDDDNGYIDDYYGWNFAIKSGDPTGLVQTPFNADHGTLTAGIVSAVSDNHTGVAGTSWNAKLMAINAGSNSEDREIEYGYEGIIYAAENGADIINCSWGLQGLGEGTKFGQDAVDYAKSLGAVVVGAAGNNGNIDPFYPSSYSNVLSVAATDSLDNLWSDSNYGPYIDLAAPGVQIYSTLAEDLYGYATGTSLAAPIVSGIVSLVMGMNSGWSSSQAAEQVRVTADYVDELPEEIGKGRLNAYSALTNSSPAIRFVDYIFVDENENGFVESGERIELKIKLINHLEIASNIKLTLIATNDYLSFINDEISISTIGTLEEVVVADPFVFDVHRNITHTPLLEFVIQIEADQYNDQDLFKFERIVSEEDFALKIWKKYIQNPVITGGKEGSWDKHIGCPVVLYNPDSSRYEMWYLGTEGINESGVWSTYRIGFAVSNDGFNWSRLDSAVLVPDPGAWDETHVLMPMVIREDRVYKMWYTGWSESDDRGKIGYATSPDGINWTKYQHNPVMAPDTASWEAGGPHYVYIIPFSEGYKMWYSGYNLDYTKVEIGYATSSDGLSWNTVDSLNPVLSVGLQDQWDDTGIWWPRVLSFNNLYYMWYSGTQRIDNPRQTGWASSSDGINWKKYDDPFTTSDLYSHSDPVLKVGDFGQWDENYAQVGTVMIEGDSLRMWYQGSREYTVLNLWKIGHAITHINSLDIISSSTMADKRYPKNFSLQQNYPNPFNPSTAIAYQLSAVSDVNLSIYNILGQKVVTLVSERQAPGKYQVEWNASSFASGVYYYKVTAGDFEDVKKMILIK